MLLTHVDGRLGADSELKTSKSGHQFLSFSIASDTFIGNGNKRTDWVRATIFDEERAKALQPLLKKGSSIIAWGKQTTRAWIDKNGQPQVGIDLTVDNFTWGASKKADETTVETVATTETSATVDCGTFKNPTQTTVTTEPTMATVGTNSLDDDLPF